MFEGEVACCHHLNTQMGALRHGSTKVSRSSLWREATSPPHFQVWVVMLHDGQGNGAHSLDTGHTWHLTHQYGRGLVFSSSTGFHHIIINIIIIIIIIIIIYMKKKMAASSSGCGASLASGLGRSKKSKCCPCNGRNARCKSCICCRSERACVNCLPSKRSCCSNSNSNSTQEPESERSRNSHSVASLSFSTPTPSTATCHPKVNSLPSLRPQVVHQIRWW